MRLLVIALCLAPLANTEDWPRFRGTNGAGVSKSGPALPSDLGPTHNVLWKTKTPKGNSSPIVVDGRIYFTGHDGDQRMVLAYDAKTGSKLWERSLTKARSEPPNPLNGLTTPTPASDGRAVYVFFPDFGLIAHSLDGKELWRVPLGPFGGIQGMAGSPICVAGNVVLLIDTPEQAYLAAWDAKTGKQAWKRERPIGWLGSYTTPAVYRPASEPEQIIVAGAVELTGYQAKTGERLWWSRGVTFGPAISPLVVDDTVYTLEPATGGEAQPFAPMLAQTDRNKNGKVEIAEETAGETAGASIYRRLFTSIDKHSGNGDGVLVEEEWAASFNPKEPTGGFARVALGGKGDLGGAAVKWRYKRGLPYVTAPLLYQGVLYVVRNGGILATFDPESGRQFGEQRLKDAIDDYYAQPVAGDGKVYFVSKEGKISVIRAGEKWELLSSSDLEEQVIATPAIVDGRIYLRTAGTLYCFAVPAA